MIDDTQHNSLSTPSFRIFEDLTRSSQRSRHLDLEDFGSYICETLSGPALQDTDDHLQGCETCAGLLDYCYEGRAWESVVPEGAGRFFSRQDWEDFRESARLLVPNRFSLHPDNRGPRADDLQRLLALFGSSCHSVMVVAVERFRELHRDFFDSVNHGLWTLIDTVLGPAEAAAITNNLIPQAIIGHDQVLRPPSLDELMVSVRDNTAGLSRLVSRENMNLLVAQADTTGMVGGALIGCDRSNLLLVVNSRGGPSAKVATLKHELFEHWVPMLLSKDLS